MSKEIDYLEFLCFVLKENDGTTTLVKYKDMASLLGNDEKTRIIFKSGAYFDILLPFKEVLDIVNKSIENCSKILKNV